MPLFRFHLRTPAGLDPDEIGLECPDLDAAYLEACRTVPEMAADLARKSLDPTAYGFVITDAQDRTLLEVPFTERLRSGRPPSRPKRAPSPRGPAGEAVRARRLVTEIQAQVAALAAAAEAAQQALHRSRALLRDEAPDPSASGE